ncbi:aminoglycoside phosphotransferase family protein [Paenibacillus sp. ACRRX]|uniref:aminoglycoside phosphotransferase family protein n=1 Tax=Paenibacillus sp. ACRRX TaxID=2918206 RepID=UPI001EF6B6AF|nr:aminoglycoside phosphotransferase family protein [Paenibacillus sp. ACRRX]MCG7409088.1 aminoglycoside phosphotransferase family protein [Paenibacillus sp. ACRRX]
MITIPEQWKQTILSVHDQQGAQWLSGLRGLIAACEAKWHIQAGSPYTLSYNYVAPAQHTDGTALVLKLCIPGQELRSELAALDYYDGQGATRLVASDVEQGVLLLERAAPGQELRTVRDDEVATRTAAAVIRRLHENKRWDRGAVSPFLSVADWAQGLAKLRQTYNGGTGPLPEHVVQQAERCYAELLSSTREWKLLHGDLHHGNILASHREPWLAIDPKGIIGEAEYEVIPYLLNEVPASFEEAIAVTERRVFIFCEELNLNRERLLDWAYAHSVLSAWWFVEDGMDGVDNALFKTSIFEQLRLQR